MANQAAIAVENALLHKERLNNQLLNKEIELASTIQSGFWPKEQPMITNYKVAGCSILQKMLEATIMIIYRYLIKIIGDLQLQTLLVKVYQPPY